MTNRVRQKYVKPMAENIFITGGTGHLGVSLISRLMVPDCRIFLLVRQKSLEKLGGLMGLAEMIKRAGTEQSIEWIAGRLTPIEGDITKPLLGLSVDEYKKLAKQTKAIYHSAAMLDLIAPWDSLYLVNVQGTRNILELGMLCAANDDFSGVFHVSTFAVAGDHKGVFKETDLDMGQGFNNAYERSKFEAERLVLDYRAKGLCITVFRPSIIVGHSQTGEARNFHTVYGPIHFLSLGIYEEIPAKNQAKLNLVSVDGVAEAMQRIFEIKGAKDNSTYHLVHETEITCEFLLQNASRYFGFRMPKITPIEEFDGLQLNGYRRKLLEPYLPYLNRLNIRWDNSAFRGVLTSSSFTWPVMDAPMLRRLFMYCHDAGYIRRKTNKPMLAQSHIANMAGELNN